jgi:hypothetical protein
MREAGVAKWIELKTFRTNEPVWVNLESAALIAKGAAAFAEATKIVIPGQPDIYVSDDIAAVIAAAKR